MNAWAATDHRSLGSLFSVGTTCSLSDAELLERFLSGLNNVSEAAFESLLLRHGPMVFAVCKRIVGDSQDAEDAFQAAFLILANRARSILEQRSVASWLYGVALRVAHRGRARTAQRRIEEQRFAAMRSQKIEAAANRPEDEPLDHETLHQEVHRLPRKYREAVVLCYLQGMTQETAASKLGCPPSTVGIRLMRVRKQLKARLSRRGISGPGGAVVAALPPRFALPALPDSLVTSTANLVLGTTSDGNLSSAAAGFMAETLKSMAMLRWARIATVVLAATIATGSLARSSFGPSLSRRCRQETNGPINRWLSGSARRS